MHILPIFKFIEVSQQFLALKNTRQICKSGGNQMVSELTFNSEDPSSNLAEGESFYSVKLLEKNENMKPAIVHWRVLNYIISVNIWVINKDSNPRPHIFWPYRCTQFPALVLWHIGRQGNRWTCVWNGRQFDSHWGHFCSDLVHYIYLLYSVALSTLNLFSGRGRYIKTNFRVLYLCCNKTLWLVKKSQDLAHPTWELYSRTLNFVNGIGSWVRLNWKMNVMYKRWHQSNLPER